MKRPALHRVTLLICSFVIGCTDEMGTGSPRTEETLFTDGAISGGQPGNSQAGVITAGEWNDLAEWDFWTNLMLNDDYSTYAKTWRFNPAKRYSFALKDVSGRPVSDAHLILKDEEGQELWASRSDNFGKAELWSGVFSEGGVPASVVVSYQNQSFTLERPRAFDLGINEINIPATANETDVIEVMLVVDATGSMADELEYLKRELYDVLDRAQQASGNQLRTSSVFYRDHGDEYVTRISPFSGAVNTTVEFVKKQSAGGGGDFPEAVHSALQNAIAQANWSPSARARLLFLMLDAPPHEKADVILNLQQLSRQAARAGIKIIPVTASGIDKSTEFLMRFFSIVTNGTYVFITNDSGIGNEHLDATVGEYEVEYLNDLMVRLIKKYSE